MMHHLPGDLKLLALADIRRVLKPGEYPVIVDFKRPENRSARPFLPMMLHRSIQVGVQDLVPLLDEAGFEGVELSDTQIKMFGYLRSYAR